MNKATLRRVYLEKRLTISSSEWNNRSDLLLSHFLKNIDLKNCRFLHTYLPIEDRKEPDTWRLINELQQRSEIKIVVSRTNWEDRRMIHYVYESKDQLNLNKYGIPEPLGGVPVPDDQIDIVLVPLIAFDRQGNRIGYGGGFYDRFLKDLAPHCLKIGYTLNMPLDDIPYTGTYDVKLDSCIYPLGYMVFEQGV